MEAPAPALRECQIHKDRHLQQVCTTCKKVICTDCQRSGHYNHPVLDIRTYVRQLREQSAEKIDELEQKSNEVKIWRRKHVQLRKDFDRSVNHTKEEIRTRGQLIIQWVNKHVEKKIAYVDYFAAENYRRELSRNISEGNRRLNALKERQAELGRIAGQELSDTQIALMTTAASEEEECRRTSLMYTSLPEAPVHRSHVYLPDMDLVDWRRGLRDFLGLPRLVQTDPRLSRKLRLAVAHHVTCSTDPDAEVLGLHVLSDGRLCVAVVCREPQTTSGSAVHLKILDVTGKNVLHDSVLPFLNKKVRFAEAASGHKLIVASAFTMETQVIDLDSSGGPCPGTSQGTVYTFQRKAPSEDSGIFNRIRRRASQPKMEYFKVYEVGLEEQKAVFSVHAEDAQTLAMDSSGRHLAVIQIEKVLDSADSHFSEMPSVVVFERPREHQHHHHHHQHHHAKEVEPKFEAIRTDRKNFFPSDLCFYKYRLSREVLVVADLANNALYKVHHESVGPVLQLLMAGCPLLDAPTALATDPKGRLVVGCRGGRVLTLVAREDVCELDYEQPRNVGIDDSSDYERAEPPHDDDDDESDVDDDKDFQAEEADSSSQDSQEEDEEKAGQDVQAQRSSRESGYGDSDEGRPGPARQPQRSSDSSCGSGQDVAWRGRPLPRPTIVSVTSSVLSRSSVSGRSESASSYSEDSAGARKDSIQSQGSIEVFSPSGTQDNTGGLVSPSDSPAVVVVSMSPRHLSHGSAPPVPQHNDCSGGTGDRGSEPGNPAVRSPPLPPPRSHHSSSDNSPERAAAHRPNNLPLSQALPAAGQNVDADGENLPPQYLDHGEERPALPPFAATEDNPHTALIRGQSIPPPLPPHGPRFGVGLLELESRWQEPEEEKEEAATVALQSPCRSSSSSQSSSSSLESPGSAYVFPPARLAPPALDLTSHPAGSATAQGSAQRPGNTPTRRPPPPKTAPKPVRL